MTQREFFNEVIAIATVNGREDLVEMAKERIAMLDKKSANRKPTKNQTENEEIKAVLLANLSNQIGIGVAELRQNDAELSKYSTQRVSAVLRLLKLEGKVTDFKEKGKTFYILP